MSTRRKSKSSSKIPNKDDSAEKPKYTPKNVEMLPKDLIWKQVVRKISISFIVMAFVYGYNYYKETNSMVTMASYKDDITGSPLAKNLPCPKDYEDERNQFPKCAPYQCGRLISDSVITQQEALGLRFIAETVFSLAQPSGGVAIFDLNSGALSNGTQFVNLFKIIKNKEQQIISKKSFDLFNKIKNKIINTISLHFGISSQHLYLTGPVFFTRITNAKAKTLNDQYWHPHIDKVTYKTFDYTSLIYLSTYQEEFTGGRFIFLDPKRNTTVEPKFGRLSSFTSGSENNHMVEQVSSGARLAITIPFTCDPKNAVNNPSLP